MKAIKICNCLRYMRKKKGYTQLKLSELTNLSQQYISNVERGNIIPSIPKAILLSEALGEVYSDIFFKCGQ